MILHRFASIQPGLSVFHTHTVWLDDDVLTPAELRELDNGEAQQHLCEERAAREEFFADNR